MTKKRSRRHSDSQKKDTPYGGIHFEGESTGPIQLIVNTKEEQNVCVQTECVQDDVQIMESKPLQTQEKKIKEEKEEEEEEEIDNVKEDIKEIDNTVLSSTLPPDQSLSLIDKISLFFAALIKTLGEAFVKAFSWIKGLFKRRDEQFENV